MLSKVRITQKFVVVCGCFEHARKVRAPTCDEAMEQKLGQAYLLDLVGLCIAICMGFQDGGCRHVARSAADKFILVSSRLGTLTQQHSTSLVPARSRDVRSYKVLLNILLASCHPVAQDAGYGLWLRRI